MMAHWARFSGGMMGRTPDYLNGSLMAQAAASDFFARNRPEFSQNIRSYYEHVRENDLALTHTLVNVRRTRSPQATMGTDEEVSLRTIRETDAGVIVRGARVLATLGPISDEIIVAPSTVLRTGPDAGQFALSFAIPCGQPGLRFICRESFDLGRTHFDHPLGSRFEEMDAIVFFDNVLVPWERLFLLDDVDLANSCYAATNAVVHMMHQVVVKNVAKAEFVLGVACLMAETLGSEQSPQVQERIAEIILDLEVMRACLRASEADAAPDDWGVTCPARIASGRRPQPLPANVPAHGRDTAAAGIEQPYGTADRGRLRHRAGARSGALPRDRHRHRPGARATVPARVGRRVQFIRLASGPLRALLLRRPLPHGRRPVRHLRQAAPQRPRPPIPGRD